MYFADYERLGKALAVPYGSGKIYIPIRTEHFYHMSTMEVYGFKNGFKTVLTQPPGTPYLFSCQDLDLDEIQIVCTDDGTKRIYKENQPIPMYLVI